MNDIDTVDFTRFLFAAVTRDTRPAGFEGTLCFGVIRPSERVDWVWIQCHAHRTECAYAESRLQNADFTLLTHEDGARTLMEGRSIRPFLGKRVWTEGRTVILRKLIRASLSPQENQRTQCKFTLRRIRICLTSTPHVPCISKAFQNVT